MSVSEILLSPAVATIACDTATAFCTVGSYVKIFEGATLLVTITLANPAFAAAVDGVAALLGTPRSGIASDSGLADSYQVYDGSDALLWTGTASDVGSGAGMELAPSAAITAGQTVSLSSWTHTAT